MNGTETKFMDKAFGRFQNLGKWPETDAILSALVTELIPELCGVPYDYLLRDDPVAMAECTLLVQEYLDIDLIIANLDIYNFEAEAMGAELKFYPDHCSDIVRSNYLIKDEKDFDKIKFKGLDTGRFPYLIKYCEAYKQYTGADTFPTMSAPWTLAGNLYGVDNLIIATMEDPEFVTEFLNRIVDDFHAPISQPSLSAAIASLERELEKLNMPGIVLQDTAFFGTAQLTGTDRKEYEDFIVWSNNMFFCIDPDLTELTPEYARRVATEHGVPLMAGIAAKQVEFGSIEETVSIIKNFVLKGKDGPTPLIFFFNNLSPKTPTDKLLAATKAVRVFGAPGADGDTPYEIPEDRPFEDFLKEKMEHNVEGYGFDWLKVSRYSHLMK